MSHLDPSDFKTLRCRGRASREAIDAVERAPGFKLPADYVEFVKACDGAEGEVGAHWLALWPVSELQELNAAYGVAEFAPGLFIFATDGGNEAYAFDMRSEPMHVVNVPLVGLSVELADPYGESFTDFMRMLSSADTDASS
jgi:hypothetical protein